MLGRLFGRKKPQAAQNEVRSLSPAIRSSVAKVVGSGGIPTMPVAAQKAFQLATDPNAAARDFIGVIEADEALAARVLKIANSVYFDRGTPSKTIEQSVTVIGINELRCLLNATTLSEIFPSRHPARAQLWANDIATALISRALTERMAPGRVELAFLGGLMHDVGKLLLLQRIPEDYQRVLDRVRTGEPCSRAEEDLLVCNHTEVGQVIGEKWNFSPELIGIIGRHHEPWPEDGQLPKALPLHYVVKAADTLAHFLGLGHPAGFSKAQIQAEEELPLVWRAVQIPEPEQREVLNRFRRMFEVEYDLYAGKVGR